MSGRPQTVQSYFVPAPIGGLNLRDPPNQIAENEARELSRFYALSNGIRARGKLVDQAETFTGSTTFLTTFTTVNGENLFLGTTANVYGKPNQISSAFVSVLPAGYAGVTVGTWNAAVFNGKIFFCNGADPGFSCQGATLNNGVLTAWTGVSPNDSVLTQVWTYRNRLYYIQTASSKTWYGGVDALTGALTLFDLSAVLKFGGFALCGTSFTYSQGLASEELWVVVSSMGEILVYSGDYPAATNWRLISRLRGPKPFGRRALIRMGADVYLNTYAGVISLSSLFAQPNLDPTSLAVSDKINRVFQGIVVTDPYDFHLTKHEIFPLIWTGLGTRIYAVNYTTGAWSLVVDSTDLSSNLKSSAWFDNKMHFLTANGKLIYIDDDLVETSSSYQGKWRTGFMMLDGQLQKRASLLRYLISPQVGTSVTGTSSIRLDFDESSTVTTDTFSKTGLTAMSTYIVEQRPPGTGRYVAPELTFNLNSSVAEIYGCEFLYEPGGIY